MTSRDRIALLVVALVVLVGGAWFTLIKPQRSALADANAAVSAAQTRLDSASATVRAARASRMTGDDDYATVARLGKAVPSDDDTPSLVVQLQDVAERSRVHFQGMTLSAGGGATSAAPVAAAPATTTATTATTATSSSAAATTPAPAAASPTTAGTGVGSLPPGAVVGAAGYSTLPFDLRFRGRYLGLQGLLSRVAGLVTVKDDAIAVRGRLLTVEGFSLTVDGDNYPQMQANVSATAYLAPEDASTAQGLVAGAKGATATAASSEPVVAAPADATSATPTASVR